MYLILVLLILIFIYSEKFTNESAALTFRYNGVITSQLNVSLEPGNNYFRTSEATDIVGYLTKGVKSVNLLLPARDSKNGFLAGHYGYVKNVGNIFNKPGIVYKEMQIPARAFLLIKVGY